MPCQECGSTVGCECGYYADLKEQKLINNGFVDGYKRALDDIEANMTCGGLPKKMLYRAHELNATCKATLARLRSELDDE